MYKRVVLIGPECSGKTTLVDQLLKMFRGVGVAEYSREYAIERSRMGKDLTFEDVTPIVKGQLELERQAESLLEKRGGDFIFYDTNPLSSMVYSQWYYEDVPEWVTELMYHKQYDLYLLMRPDLDWVDDPARAMPVQAERDAIFIEFEKILRSHGCTYVTIEGKEEIGRLLQAKNAIERYFRT